MNATLQFPFKVYYQLKKETRSTRELLQLAKSEYEAGREVDLLGKKYPTFELFKLELEASCKVQDGVVNL